MSEILSFLSVVVACGTVLTLAFLILLALPDSRMRQVAQQAFLALACLAYFVWPLDIMPEALLGPFGLLDDLGAAFVGLKAARKAIEQVGRL